MCLYVRYVCMDKGPGRSQSMRCVQMMVDRINGFKLDVHPGATQHNSTAPQKPGEGKCSSLPSPFGP